MIKQVIFSSVIALAAAGTAYGQSSTQQDMSRSQSATQQDSRSTQANSEQKSKQTLNYQAAASKLIGTTVENAQGEQVGDIKDLIMKKDHKVSHAIVSVGGFLGVGDRLVAVPIDKLRIQQDKVVISSNRQQIAALPEFQYREDMNKQRAESQQDQAEQRADAQKEQAEQRADAQQEQIDQRAEAQKEQVEKRAEATEQQADQQASAADSQQSQPQGSQE